MKTFQKSMSLDELVIAIEEKIEEVISHTESKFKAFFLVKSLTSQRNKIIKCNLKLLVLEQEITSIKLEEQQFKKDNADLINRYEMLIKEKKRNQKDRLRSFKEKQVTKENLVVFDDAELISLKGPYKKKRNERKKITNAWNRLEVKYGRILNKKRNQKENFGNILLKPIHKNSVLLYTNNKIAGSLITLSLLFNTLYAIELINALGATYMMTLYILGNIVISLALFLGVSRNKNYFLTWGITAIIFGALQFVRFSTITQLPDTVSNALTTRLIVYVIVVAVTCIVGGIYSVLTTLNRRKTVKKFNDVELRETPGR